MIPILYEKDETEFTSNGIARLQDCISCVVTEERNSVYECEFEYPVSGANYDLIKCGRIIAVTHDETNDIQPFDIVSFSRPIDGIVTFHAVHISYRQSKMTVSGTEISSATDALKLLTTAEPENPFGYWTDIESTALFAAADGVPRSVRQMLGGVEGSILDCYGGEYEWDKWLVKLWRTRGVARDFTIRYGVNLMNYDEEVDYSETYTACIPFWVGNDNTENVDTNSDNTVVVKGNKVSTNVAPYDGREACIPLDLSDKFEEKPTAQELEDMALQLMNEQNVYIPAQTITVEFVRLQDSPEYENYANLMQCRLCDSVNVVFPNYDVLGSFKIVRTVYNVIQDRFDEMELGTLSITLTSAIDSSGSSPSVSTVNIIKATSEAQNDAKIANGILISMDEAAQAAGTTLTQIYQDAEDAAQAASNAQTSAGNALTAAQNAQTAAGNAQTAAQNAQTSAGNALTAAQNAQTSADSALVSLANVQDVIGVLEWITAHGTMTANGSTALSPSKVYFVVDANGDYVVGGTHYSVVAEPKAADRTSYYTLSVDESVQNYVATHLVVDSEGLWLIPDSGGNKVLIATGAGSAYTTAGTYIIGKVSGVDTVFAKFLQTGMTINATNNVQIAHLGYGTGNAESGTATEPYYTLGQRSGSIGNYSIVEGAQVPKTTAQGGGYFPIIASGYASHAENGGTTASGSYSHAEGCVTEARAHSSHAEGRFTVAQGNFSHAEGDGSIAQGDASHAQNTGTLATMANQTVLGKYNDTSSTQAVIIGNGTADDARSNALTVDWDGNVQTRGEVTYKHSTIDASKANNNISSGTLYPTTFNILDSSSRIMSRMEAAVSSSGPISAYWYVRNYNTSGTQVGQKGIKMTMAKDGTLTYSVDDTDKFRTAIKSVSLTHGNELNAHGGVQNGNFWFNYRNADTDTTNGSNATTTYCFGNYNGGITGTTIKGDKANLSGELTMNGSDVVLGTSSSSSNDSGDIVWKYGNGNEKMRIWSPNDITSLVGPNFRIYNSSGTQIYSGSIPVYTEGTSGSWKYRKWSSGKIEAWCSDLELASATPSTWVSPVRYTDTTITIPSGIFSSAPSVQVTSTDNQWGVFSAKASSATSISTRFITCATSASTPNVNVYAIQL